MKRYRILAVVAAIAAVMMCSCESTLNAELTGVDEKTTTTAASSEQATAVSFSETIAAEKTPNKLTELAEYKSDNKLMSAISRLAAKQVEKYPDLNVNTDKFCKYAYTYVNDIQGELALIFPCGKGYAFYIIDNDGNTTLVYEDESEDIDQIFLSVNINEDENGNYFTSAYTCTYVDDVNTYCSRFLDSNYCVFKTVTQVSVNENHTFYEDGVETNEDYFALHKSTGVFQKKVAQDYNVFSPEAIEEELIKWQSQTLLDSLKNYINEHEYYSNGELLIDISGDNFPEVFCMEDGLNWYISFLNYRYEELIQLFCGELNEIYVCRDGDKRFITWSFDSGYEVGYSDFSIYRFDINQDGSYENTELGNMKAYLGWDKAYNKELYFTGSDIKPIGLYDYNSEYTATSELDKAFKEYISNYEVIDIITVSYYDGKYHIESQNPVKDFADYPTHQLKPVKIEVTEEVETILVGDTEYPLDSDYIKINSSIDTDILNSFKNLKTLHISVLGKTPLVIKNGEWCDRITDLRISMDNVIFADDFKGFRNVTDLGVYDIFDGLNVVPKYFPNTEVYHLGFMIESKEQLEPLLKLKNLKVIVDSGHGSRLCKLSTDERNEILNLFSNYIWDFIK